MISKTCKRCGESKPLSEFYKHSKMADGHLSFCRSCTVARIKAERRANPDKHTAREKARFVGDRKKKMTEAAAVRYRVNPFKSAARSAVNNAVRDGRLLKAESCSRCGRTKTRIEGHHDDYNKPLEVIWLCARCHRRHHADNPHLPE